MQNKACRKTLATPGIMHTKKRKSIIARNLFIRMMSFKEYMIENEDHDHFDKAKFLFVFVVHAFLRRFRVLTSNRMRENDE